jgi:hypothetical protein
VEITCKGCGQQLRIINTNNPIVRCGKCGYPNPVTKPSGSPPPPPKNQEIPKPPVEVPKSSGVPNNAPNRPGVDSEVGWLVVHDESTTSQTLPLSIGRQIIGRKNSGRPCKIMIDSQDEFMSRNHCTIEVRVGQQGGYDYFLMDQIISGGTAKNMSANGTRVNAGQHPLKPNDVVYLNDGDVIQIGMTKVVVKTLRTVSTSNDATRVVKNADYAPTFILKK